MILKIIKYGQPALRKKSAEIKEISGEIKKIASEMIETMKMRQGIGLSAPQVGILKRIVVVDNGERTLCLINPRIIKKSAETETKEEGCLSFPKLFLDG